MYPVRATVESHDDRLAFSVVFPALTHDLSCHLTLPPPGHASVRVLFTLQSVSLMQRWDVSHLHAPPPSGPVALKEQPPPIVCTGVQASVPVQVSASTKEAEANPTNPNTSNSQLVMTSPFLKLARLKEAEDLLQKVFSLRAANCALRFEPRQDCISSLRDRVALGVLYLFR